LPLLQARYVLARLRPAWLALPHLDLLMPARRVWRDRLPSCALSSLEAHVLNVQREQDDVPGYLIPQMYLEYLQTGDASEMPRVIYHNQQDILSMVTLTVRLCRMFGDPLAEETLDPADLVSLGKWYDDLEMSAEAERAFRTALERDLHPTPRAVALTRLGLLMKRQNRRQEAIAVWEELAQADDWGVLAHVELAKHFEWHALDLEQALMWTRAALKIITAWPPGFVRDQASAQLEHRLQRLKRKQEGKRVE
jgi:tetratricopeptide (TPR) repeat protein